MATKKNYRPTYTVPAWAKRVLGARDARRYARAEMARAKADGASFEEACARIDRHLAEAVDHAEMAGIELQATYGLGGSEA